VAPVPGTVVQVLVVVGDQVTAGQVVVVIEAMKVEHAIRTAVDGAVVRVLVAVGESVDAHAPLLEVEP
jgi:biotin carboxyl carrier protein